MKKIIRTICLFCDGAGEKESKRLQKLQSQLEEKGFEVQTKRICLKNVRSNIDLGLVRAEEVMVSLGRFKYEELKEELSLFLESDYSLNLDLTKEEIEPKHVDLLYEIIEKNPSQTFNFAYGFNLPAGTPYFPSAYFGERGFSVGLQPTNLSEGCETLDGWLGNMSAVWKEVVDIFKWEGDFLGIDSSIAPMNEKGSSFVGFIAKLYGGFNESVATDAYTQISRFVKEKNPEKVGLCGLMFPALEDLELAKEYEKGNFSIERNIFLSLHSGTGIDTYPIGIDESKEKVLNILKLVQALSNKYKKPLSVRFVSDGKAKIGKKTHFKNKYLKDVTVRPL